MPYGFGNRGSSGIILVSHCPFKGWTPVKLATGKQQNDRQQRQGQKDRNYISAVYITEEYSSMYADSVTEMTQYSKHKYDMTALHFCIYLLIFTELESFNCSIKQFC